MSKRRSKSQRIGTAGEDHFRLFAGRNRLIASKCEQDFGTDFLCQIEGVQGKTGEAPVLGRLLGAFVRSTENKRGRIRLDREDVEHLLACEYPVLVVLVHLPKDREAAIYFRFVDGEFGEMLADYLTRNEKSISLTPTNLNEERMLTSELSRALTPGFVEQFRVSLAAKSLDRVIPHSRVQVRRSQDGSITLGPAQK